MPPRTAKQILAEWHDLAMERDETSDDDLADGLSARIEQLRREYIEGTPAEERADPVPTQPQPEPTLQMKLRL